MSPEDTGNAYNTITHLWTSEEFNRSNGMSALDQALAYLPQLPEGAQALDVGCGCTCRFYPRLAEQGLSIEGIDVSSGMLAIAQRNYPAATFNLADICTYPLQPNTYHFIMAWDSIWHVPLTQQPSLIKKLCDALAPNGVFIFSFGGVETAGEHYDNYMGPTVYYASLGIHGFIELAMQTDCIIKHLNVGKGDEPHSFIVLQRKS